MRKTLIGALLAFLLAGVWAFAGEINDLSTTDASNTNSSYGFPENMAPSAVNDNLRALEGILARWHKDVSGSVHAYGSANAVRVTANRTISAYYDGLFMAFTVTAANTGTATFQIGSLSALTIYKNFNQALAANDFKVGQKVAVIYDSTNTAWQMISDVANTPGTVTSVTAADASIVAGGTASAVTMSRGAITGDVSVPQGSNTATVANSGVSAGTYRNADITVSAKGFVTTATTGTESFIIACSDESTAITTGTNKVRFRMPYALTLSTARASLSITSSSGPVTLDVNESGTSILSTKLFVAQGESTSLTASTAAVLSDTSLANDAEMTIDVDAAGSGAKGCKVTLIGTRT